MTTPFSLPQVLLVEDTEDDERLSLKGIAQSEIPCDVHVARDGAEALDLLFGPEPIRPALVLLDYRMPKYTGLQVLMRMRGNDATRYLPAVIFSGTTWGPELTECYKHGANSCVVKPDDPKVYLDTLKRAAEYWLTINQGLQTGFVGSMRNAGERGPTLAP